ncbi:MAG: rRNA maturation RNase YbeY [Hyphomonadaceae bacterium]|nr:rRNA maturation RNase YbeY [Hyphomonadaceae bacterium]
MLIADAKWEAALAGAEPFVARVLAAAAHAEQARGDVSVLLADAGELARLNRAHRGIDKPTNVLSFPAPAGAFAEPFLGDIAIAFEVTAAEAETEGKRFADHAAHLLTHGFLHLLGYDHMNDADAERMEAREREILASLGIADPYAAERV